MCWIDLRIIRKVTKSDTIFAVRHNNNKHIVKREVINANFKYTNEIDMLKYSIGVTSFLDKRKKSTEPSLTLLCLVARFFNNQPRLGVMHPSKLSRRET